jgi:hypothetical protein
MIKMGKDTTLFLLTCNRITAKESAVREYQAAAVISPVYLILRVITKLAGKRGAV